MSVPTDPGAERKATRAPALADGTPGEGRAVVQPAAGGGASAGAGAGARAGEYLGVVFAGGESRRMGQDKALLPWPIGSADSGESASLMERAARMLEGLCRRVEVARGPRGGAPDPGRPVIHDVAEGAGPLAGLLAALERARELGAAGVVALACDMPLVERGEIEPLFDAMSAGGGTACEAAMWVVDEREQPLCAVYGIGCLPAARAAFKAGKRRLVAIFDPAATGGHVAVLKRLYPDEKTSVRLVNLNTMTDYDRVMRDLRPGGH